MAKRHAHEECVMRALLEGKDVLQAQQGSHGAAAYARFDTVSIHGDLLSTSL